MPPIIPVNHDPNSKNQQNKTKALKLLFHANVFKAFACWEHSDFLKVKDSDATPHSQVQKNCPSKCQSKTKYSPRGRTGQLQQTSNYELFNRNNFNIHYWSWNYRGCWHQTCPPMDT